MFKINYKVAVIVGISVFIVVGVYLVIGKERGAQHVVRVGNKIIDITTTSNMVKNKKAETIAAHIKKDDCQNATSTDAKLECLDRYQYQQLGLENDPRNCLKMSEWIQRNNCLMVFFSSYKEIDNCKKIASKDFRERCNESVGTSVMGIKYCELLKDEPNEYLECKDRYAAMEMARNGDIKICGKLKTLEYGFLCEINALKLGKESCSGMPTSDKFDLCQSRVQYSKAKSLEDCNKIKKENYKKVCLSAIKHKDDKTYNFDDDNDGLNNAKELWLSTDPFNADSDGDTLTDFDEYNKFKTNPISKDTDNDGYTDAEELIAKTDPEDPGSHPNIRIESIAQQNITNENASSEWWLVYEQKDISDNTWKRDSDDDGLIDVDEVFYGTDPFKADTDNDGILDSKEVLDMTNPIGKGELDMDGDGLSDKKEIENGTNPYIIDTNKDGINDKEAIDRGIEAIKDDTDSDGLNNLYEIDLGTNPLVADTDGDGNGDGKEVNLNFNPCGEGELPTKDLLKKACEKYVKKK